MSYISTVYHLTSEKPYRPVTLLLSLSKIDRLPVWISWCFKSDIIDELCNENPWLLRTSPEQCANRSACEQRQTQSPAPATEQQQHPHKLGTEWVGSSFAKMVLLVLVEKWICTSFEWSYALRNMLEPSPWYQQGLPTDCTLIVVSVYRKL